MNILRCKAFKVKAFIVILLAQTVPNNKSWAFYNTAVNGRSKTIKNYMIYMHITYACVQA